MSAVGVNPYKVFHKMGLLHYHYNDDLGLQILFIYSFDMCYANIEQPQLLIKQVVNKGN